MNNTAVDRGLGRSTTLKTTSDTITKNASTSQNDVFKRPERSEVIGIKMGNYSKLTELGYVPEETVIENGDIIIGKISPLASGAASSARNYKDESAMYRSNVPAVVDRVYTGITNADGYEHIITVLRSERRPTIGDKFASRCGQKGTIGFLLSDADMPWSESGIQPDIIINPCCCPSRMTIGQLVESVVSKNAALKCEPFDATPFNEVDLESVYAELKGYGFQEHGYETMYCGMTGKKMETKIFIGPTYYLRLKHMVSDKLHSRAQGPSQNLTRQPLEGRARDGGLRFGEMERDCMIAHQCSLFLKERLVDTSDVYTTYVCNRCGLIAAKYKERDIWYCPACKKSQDPLRNPTDVSRVVMPYAFKLLVQELEAINILPRIKVR